MTEAKCPRCGFIHKQPIIPECHICGLRSRECLLDSCQVGYAVANGMRALIGGKPGKTPPRFRERLFNE